MAPKSSHPKPIFDNLEHLGNPFRASGFNTDFYFANAEPLTSSHLDYEFAWKFLYSYNGSSATFASYRREIERLLLWCWLIHQKAVVTLKREDIEAFIGFIQNPPTSWIGLKNVGRFKSQQGSRTPNDEWRPFVAKVSKTAHKDGREANKKAFTLSQAAVKATFAILSSFYNFLIQEEIKESNPVLLIRQKSKFIQNQQHRAPVRRISILQWDYVIETAEMLAKNNPDEHERTLFIMNCLFSMYLRISELVADERSTPLMADFRKDLDGNWWFHVVGKGNKSRPIVVSDAMLNALRRYRHFRGLSALPTQDENTVLIPKSRGTGPISSTRQIRNIVQYCFDSAYERMVKAGLEEDAGELRSATVHWLRHTGISEDVKIRPREHVRDDAGHASMQTTDRYIESDLRERHASGKRKRLKDF